MVELHGRGRYARRGSTAVTAPLNLFHNLKIRRWIVFWPKFNTAAFHYPCSHWHPEYKARHKKNELLQIRYVEITNQRLYIFGHHLSEGCGISPNTHWTHMKHLGAVVRIFKANTDWMVSTCLKRQTATWSTQ